MFYQRSVTIDSSDARVRISINRRLLLALALAFVYHGALLLSGTYKGTYDAYVHIFFADHYARSWWDPWDARWYTGFPLTSYPPVHSNRLPWFLLALVESIREALPDEPSSHPPQVTRANVKPLI
ncbi:MAG: hypothetical protein SH847_14285, partial [Roseiflexaceae bacterium]|nr:hypothetical protein [Roseiflexaceae bacterium]